MGPLGVGWALRHSSAAISSEAELVVAVALNVCKEAVERDSHGFGDALQQDEVGLVGAGSARPRKPADRCDRAVLPWRRACGEWRAG